MEERRYCVYRHVTPDGLMYIGQTQQKPRKRWGSGRFYKANPEFTAAVDRFGWKNIRHEILENGLTKEEAYSAERRYIELWETTNPQKGYNKLKGEQHKQIFCVETNTLYESFHDASRKTGIKRDSLKLACLGITAGAGGFHWCYANERNGYQIDKSRKMSPSPKLVRNLETGEIFNSVGEAARKYDTSAQQIGAVCNKKTHRKTAAKCRWEFADRG